MTVYVVNVWVKPGFEQDFLQASLENHQGTRQEKGNHRFDVLQSKDSPQEFCLYEVYENDAAVAAHKETAHYLKWRETVEPWMARKREGSKFSGLVPQENENW